MAMATHIVSLPLPTQFSSGVSPSPRFTSPPGCVSCGLEQWNESTGMRRKLCKSSVGRQSQQGRIFLVSCNAWHPPDVESFKGRMKQQPKTVTAALPTEVSAAAAAIAVGGALFALTKLNKSTEEVLPAKTECEACGGSGLCPACNGEGFVNKNLSAEAAAKARATAKDAATRYTAGLAKKWNYCTTCSGGRGCLSCEGRGWIA
ncbi:unnamed protein product [Calypogeia fissa]